MKFLSKQSEIGKIKKQCDKLFFEILKIKKGKRCEVCGATVGVGPAHILTKASNPRLRYVEANLILLCWYPHHHMVHHDFRSPKAREVEAYIVKTLGPNYEDNLRIIEATQSKQTLHYMNLKKVQLEQELRDLTKGE